MQRQWWTIDTSQSHLECRLSVDAIWMRYIDKGMRACLRKWVAGLPHQALASVGYGRGVSWGSKRVKSPPAGGLAECAIVRT
jgi:hypothetical protein